VRRRVYKRALSRDEAVIECNCVDRLKGLGKKNGVSDSETADVASHNRYADRCAYRIALITPTITLSSARVVTVGTASRRVVRIDWPFPAIHPPFRDLSKGPPFSLFTSLNAVPRRCKKDVFYSADNRKRLVNKWRVHRFILCYAIVLANLART